MSDDVSSISDNIKRVQERIAEACVRAHRDPDSVTLVAVSKRKPTDAILDALAAGVQHFGENRVQESQTKLPQVAAQLNDLPPPIWHMIGHVQSRQAKYLVPLFSVFHAVDSVRLAQKMSKLAQEEQRQLDIFVQVNVSGEVQKYGLHGADWRKNSATVDQLVADVGHIMAQPNLHLRGLMTMAPYDAPEAELRTVFASLAALKSELESQLSVTLPDLSMGMTDDYPIAIEEGATVVRVGRAIFGER